MEPRPSSSSRTGSLRPAEATEAAAASKAAAEWVASEGDRPRRSVGPFCCRDLCNFQGYYLPFGSSPSSAGISTVVQTSFSSSAHSSARDLSRNCTKASSLSDGDISDELTGADADIISLGRFFIPSRKCQPSQMLRGLQSRLRRKRRGTAVSQLAFALRRRSRISGTLSVRVMFHFCRREGANNTRGTASLHMYTHTLSSLRSTFSSRLLEPTEALSFSGEKRRLVVAAASRGREAF